MTLDMDKWHASKYLRHKVIVSVLVWIECWECFHWTLESQDLRRKMIYKMSDNKNCLPQKGFLDTFLWNKKAQLDIRRWLFLLSGTLFCYWVLTCIIPSLLSDLQLTLTLNWFLIMKQNLGEKYWHQIYV